MKALIAILLVLSYSLSFAENKAHAPTAAHGEGHGSGKAPKDWNEVFKQPATNAKLAEAPAATQALAPDFLSQVKGTEVTLKWKALEGVKYHLQVATDPNFKWLIVNEPLVTYTEYALKNLEPKQQYFWRVYTQKPDNNASYTKGPAVGSTFETVQ